MDNSEQIIAENILKIQNEANEATGYKNVIKPFYYGNKYYMITSKLLKMLD